jgi:uncharacterized membrane protein
MTRPDSSPGTRAGSPAPGFLLERGRYTPVAIPPHLAATAPQGILPFGINDRRQIVGEYIDDRNVPHGFLLDQHGRFTRLDVPDAKATNAAKINNQGQIVGAYSDTTTDLYANGVPRRGFLLDKHGRYIRLDVPGARSSQPLDINDRGQVAGEYQDAAGTFHGYVWESGRFRTIDLPGQTMASASGINNRGQLTGSTGRPETADGFVLDRGRVASFDAPGGQITLPTGINDHGQVVGLSLNELTDTTPSGFLRESMGAVHRDQAARRQHHRRY